MEKDRTVNEILEEHYSGYDEDARLGSRHGQVEYLTTVKYMDECLAGIDAPAVIEIGAGTGRYSIMLAKRGVPVTAVELTSHNIGILKSKLDGTEPIEVYQGNALDLGFLPDASYDLTLLLGPMYHLFAREDKLRALSEAVRVTKPGGHIMVAYCMNEACVLQYVFGGGNLKSTLDRGMLTPDWRCVSCAEEVFELVRTEEIADLDAELPVDRIKLVAADGPAHYMKALLESMDGFEFDKWMEYHFATCERQDVIGASNHTIDILRKR